MNKQELINKLQKLLTTPSELEGYDFDDGNVLTEENIEKILESVEHKNNEEYFAQLISQEKIAEADYNLSVSTYVEKEDTREKIDIDVLNKEIAETVKNIDRLRTEIDKIVEELS